MHKKEKKCKSLILDRRSSTPKYISDLDIKQIWNMLLSQIPTLGLALLELD